MSTQHVAEETLDSLVVDVRKQQLFMEKVLNHRRVVLKDVEGAVCEYMQFLRVSGKTVGQVSPNLFIDDYYSTLSTRHLRKLLCILGLFL